MGRAFQAQCLLFMVGSSLFASATAPGVSARLSPLCANLLCFVGAWFFTSAGLIQLLLSRPAALRAHPPRLAHRGRERLALTHGFHTSPEWLASVTQSAGTLLFNVSTAAALVASTTAGVRHWVWRPDALGSAAFLLSASFVVVGWVRHAPWWDPGVPEWWSGLINLVGCVAFGVSAVSAFVLADGAELDGPAATWGTFVGACCFFLASLIPLVSRPSAPQSKAKQGPRLSK